MIQFFLSDSVSERLTNIKRSIPKITATALLASAVLVLPTQPAQAEEPATKGIEIFEKLQNHIGTISDEVKSSVVHIEVLSKKGTKRRKGMGRVL